MTPERYDFGFVGGDMRQVYGARILAEKGYKVCTYGLPKRVCKTKEMDSMEHLAQGSDNIVGPIPLTKNKEDVFCSSKSSITMEQLRTVLGEGKTLYAGCIPPSFREALEKSGAYYYDLMEDEPLTLYNTIATAEGAIAEAVTKSAENLSHSPCLVLGYGRCARTLCAYLKGMFCEVTVCARRADARAMASVIVDQTISPEELTYHVGLYSFIFNTVPSQILTRDLLEKMSPNTTIIDIASAPGGVDYEAAKEQNMNAYLCLGLPGKYAPGSSGKMIAETLIQLSAGNKE